MEGLSSLVEKFIDKTIQVLQNDVLKKKIQILIMEPFLQHIIDLVFPYLIIICVVFSVMIIMMMSILALLFFQPRPSMQT
jgi:hypothetical protein